MNEARRFSSALLLIGSPRGINSNSESLGGYLSARLRERGVPTFKIYVHASMATEQGHQQMLKAIGDSDLVIMSFPLYVDSIPSPVIAAMESIVAHRREDCDRPKKLVAIIQCGFPEALHNNTAMSIVKRFAKEAGMEWAGGLALGGGEVIGRKSLEDAGRMVRNICASLDMTATALANGEDVPEDAIKLMEKKVVPMWLYFFVGTRNWKKTAKENGAQGKLYNRPFSTG